MIGSFCLGWRAYTCGVRQTPGENGCWPSGDFPRDHFQPHLTPERAVHDIRGSKPGVRWQSGDASDCKSAYAGSIPARTSNGTANNNLEHHHIFGCERTAWMRIRNITRNHRRADFTPIPFGVCGRIERIVAATILAAPCRSPA
jgi:hypothetical protein